MAKDPKSRKNFFKNFKAELKKVIWPTPKQIVNGTTAVIIIVLIIAAIVFVLDLTFDFLNTNEDVGLNRFRRVIESRQEEPEYEGQEIEAPAGDTEYTENGEDYNRVTDYYDTGYYNDGIYE